VDFVDNRLNGNTGTIRMRAIFANPRGSLKAGLFVRIRLPIGQPYKSLLIPDEAIQSDQGKKYVYVIDAEEKAQYRPITQGQPIQGAPIRVNGVLEPEPTLRVIKDGLKPGERVVITGMQRVQRQKPVQATMKPPPQSPGFPLGKLLYPK
jgi:membrane fusion protein, multidrug efflux system